MKTNKTLTIIISCVAILSFSLFIGITAAKYNKAEPNILLNQTSPNMSKTSSIIATSANQSIETAKNTADDSTNADESNVLTEKESQLKNGASEKSTQKAVITSIKVTEKNTTITQENTRQAETGKKNIDKTTTEKVVTTKKATTTETIKAETTKAQVPRNNSSSMENEMFKLVNEARVANGLPKLSRSSSLYEPALVRAYECSVNWSHTRPNGKDMETVLDEYGISNYSSVGENLVKASSSTQHAFDSLMNSPGHKANILRPEFTAMAIGSYIDSSGAVYISQIFITER